MIVSLLFAGGVVRAQSVPVDVEGGYRWVHVTGNEQMYRSQVNDHQGFLLRSLLYDSSGPLGVVDFLRLDASDLGAGPAGAFKLAVGRSDKFRLDFSFRHQNLYSALPAFANPLLDDGIVPGQHTMNRGRQIYEVNLQILPGGVVSPILGYTRNDYHGPGRTTYTLGGDDFALDDDLKAVDEEYRIGLAFHTGPVEGGVTQGWRRYREKDTDTLRPGANAGNQPGTLLDVPVTASGIQRSTSTSVDTPVTSAWLTGRFRDCLKLTGSYVHASPDGDTSSLESDAGSFVSFQISRFFAGLTDTIASTTDQNWWRGTARAEFNFAPGIDLVGGWTGRGGTLTGMALISSLYQNTVTFAGQSTGDLLRVLQTHNSIDRNERLFDATVTVRLWSPLAINAGWVQTHQDVTVTPDAAEILVAGGQGGRYQRTVNSFGAGATYSMAGLTLGADYRRDDAGDPIFRTDYRDRDRWKLRGSWGLRDLLRISANFQETHAKSDDPELAYDTKVRDVSADVEITAVPKILQLHGSIGGFKASRSILERMPQDFSIAPASHAEFGHTWEGGAIVTIAPVSFDAAYLYLTNSGNVPFTLERIKLRAEVTLTSNLSAVGEWWRDKYVEPLGTGVGQAGPLANYNGNRYFVGLHWRPGMAEAKPETTEAKPDTKEAK